MGRKKRRDFIKGSAAAVSSLALAKLAPSKAEASPQELDRDVLTAVGRVVLPLSTLGESGVTLVVALFRRWLDGFEPVAELPHPYLTEEILYGPPDPGPRWAAQLEALNLEADKRYGTSFVELSDERKLDFLHRQIRDDRLDSLLGNAADARHVAVGLLAYFYNTPEATDICYEAAIREGLCRGLATAPEKPAPLGKEG